MTEEDFKSEFARAETLRRSLGDPKQERYWRGYLAGLRKRYHGNAFGTEQEHERWIKAINHRDPMRRMEARGYRDGWKGSDAPTTKPDLIRALRDQRAWTQVDLARRLQVDTSTVGRWETGADPSTQAWLLVLAMWNDPYLDILGLPDPTA